MAMLPVTTMSATDTVAIMTNGLMDSLIEYTETRHFTQRQVEQLFLSVGWMSGRYPAQLYRALQQSSYVLTAWHGHRLVGLIRGIDDGGMTAFLHYLLVDPAYQHQGIASHLIESAKAHYRDFLYINVMPEESSNAPFYERHGLCVMPDGVAMQKSHPGFANDGQ